MSKCQDIYLNLKEGEEVEIEIQKKVSERTFGFIRTQSRRNRGDYREHGR